MLIKYHSRFEGIKYLSKHFVLWITHGISTCVLQQGIHVHSYLNWLGDYTTTMLHVEWYTWNNHLLPGQSSHPMCAAVIITIYTIWQTVFKGDIYNWWAWTICTSLQVWFSILNKWLGNNMLTLWRQHQFRFTWINVGVLLLYVAT